MDTSAFNILERVIIDRISDEMTQREARILVTRHSLLPSHFGPRFDGVADQPGYGISRLMSSVEQRDWTACFRLDPLANSSARSVLELHHSHYSDLVRNPHSHVLFSFSAPVVTADGFLFYGTLDRGFLWARGFLCRFQGSFDTPEAIEYLHVWSS